jgi:hypothetical protein
MVQSLGLITSFWLLLHRQSHCQRETNPSSCDIVPLQEYFIYNYNTSHKTWELSCQERPNIVNFYVIFCYCFRCKMLNSLINQDIVSLELMYRTRIVTVKKKSTGDEDLNGARETARAFIINDPINRQLRPYIITDSFHSPTRPNHAIPQTAQPSSFAHGYVRQQHNNNSIRHSFYITTSHRTS